MGLGSESIEVIIDTLFQANKKDGANLQTPPIVVGGNRYITFYVIEMIVSVIRSETRKLWEKEYGLKLLYLLGTNRYRDDYREAFDPHIFNNKSNFADFNEEIQIKYYILK